MNLPIAGIKFFSICVASPLLIVFFVTKEVRSMYRDSDEENSVDAVCPDFEQPAECANYVMASANCLELATQASYNLQDNLYASCANRALNYYRSIGCNF